MPSPIRDAISLAIFELDDDRESIDLVLHGWRDHDASPLVWQLAGFLGGYVGRDKLELLAQLAAADPRCAA
jgi:hypothetical protein